MLYEVITIGRASYGRPWIFEQIYQYYKTGIVPSEPDFNQRIDVMLKHAKMIIANKGEAIGMKEARKHVAWYIKGLHNAAFYRNSCGT